MKKLISILALASAFLSPPARAQINQPWNNTAESFSQMWNGKANAAGAYFDGATQSTLGSQLDSFGTGMTNDPLYLYIAKFIIKPSPLLDTVIPAPIYGTGKLTIGYSVWKATTTGTANPVVVATLQQSCNGFQWDAISGVSAQTVTPTAVYSTSVAPTSGTFQFVDKSGLLYRLKLSATADTASAQSWYYYQKNQVFYLNR